MSKDGSRRLSAVSDIVTLLDRPLYAIPSVDRLLALTPGTARRWIDGYMRSGRMYPPVIRIESTGDEVVTWGEFVEARLLSEYRAAGVPLARMRPAIEKLRETFNTMYPLARSHPFVAGRELVLKAQESVRLDHGLLLVVIRNDQLVLTDRANSFVSSADFTGDEGIVERLRPVSRIAEVVIDPLRQFGEPVVRSVRTEIIAEQVRAGESIDAIVESYELSRSQVEAAIQYELVRESPDTIAA